MTGTTTYTAMPISEVPTRIWNEDFNVGNNTYAVVRRCKFEYKGEMRILEKVWSFHATEQLAKRAVKRGLSREIRTR